MMLIITATSRQGNIKHSISFSLESIFIEKAGLTPFSFQTQSSFLTILNERMRIRAILDIRVLIAGRAIMEDDNRRTRRWMTYQ